MLNGNYGIRPTGRKGSKHTKLKLHRGLQLVSVLLLAFGLSVALSPNASALSEQQKAMLSDQSSNVGAGSSTTVNGSTSEETLGNTNAASGFRFVAVGDSYAAGLGAGSYYSGSGSCERSHKSYSRLWAENHTPLTFVFSACSGAKTTDVTSSQLGHMYSSTALVSITVGGNDVGFADVMTDCMLYSTSTCVSDVNTAENKMRTQLPGKLDATYNAIRAHAPHARVVVVGYPRFYHVGVWDCIGLSDTARSKINESANVLDDVISAAAARQGFYFADVRSRFASGHEICDDNSWLHSVDWTDLEQSYHPTASGQSGGYLPAFAALAS